LQLPHNVQARWKLLPHFLRLMKQHVTSFDYFVQIEIKKVVAAERHGAAISSSKCLQRYH
jgi:hypothetical protein